MIHRLNDLFDSFSNKNKKESKNINDSKPNNTIEQKNNIPKLRKNRFSYKKKNWRRDIISMEIFLLIIFIFLPVIFYITGHMKFNF